MHREPHSTGVTAAPLPAAPQVLSEHRDPHCVSPVSRIFADNTDLSIDRFPLSEAESAADTCEQRPGPQPSRAGRVLEARARRRRPGWVPRVPWSPRPPRPHPCKNRLLRLSVKGPFPYLRSSPLWGRSPGWFPSRTTTHLPRSRPLQARPLVIQDHPQASRLPRTLPRQDCPSRGRAPDLTTPSPPQDAGPSPPAEHRQDLPLARGASAVRGRRDPRAGAPARHPR